MGQTLTYFAKGPEMESIGKLDPHETIPYTLIKLTPSHLKILEPSDFTDGNKGAYSGAHDRR